MSTLKTSNLQHASAASPAIVLAADGSATLNGLAYPTNGSLSGRNRIINGAMEIAQRGTSHTANGLYTLDRWTMYNSGGTFTISQQTAASGSQPENGMAKFVRIARTSPSGILYFTQKIEDVTLYDGFPVTVSFYAKANTNITLPVRLVQEFGSGGSAPVTVGTVNTSVTTSWAKYTANFTLPSQSGKTIGTSSFLEMTFDTPATYSTLDITGVQLEAGTVATPFERRSYGQELALCQRYYYRVVSSGASNNYARLTVSGQCAATTQAIGQVLFSVTMRTAPTALETTGTASDYSVFNSATSGVACTSIVFNAASTHSGEVQANTASGLTAGNASNVLANNNTTAYLGWSAEL
jgi:hypothetical protein